MKLKERIFKMSDLHPLDIIEDEINSFLDDRYPNFTEWPVPILAAEQDIRQEMSFLMKKHLPDDPRVPDVYVDESNVIHICLREVN